MATVAPFRRNDGGRAVCTQIPYGIAIVSMQIPHPLASHSDLQCPLALTNTPAPAPAPESQQCTHAQTTTAKVFRGNEFKNHRKIKKAPCQNLDAYKTYSCSYSDKWWVWSSSVSPGVCGGCRGTELLFRLFQMSSRCLVTRVQFQRQ